MAEQINVNEYYPTLKRGYEKTLANAKAAAEKAGKSFNPGDIIFGQTVKEGNQEYVLTFDGRVITASLWKGDYNQNKKPDPNELELLSVTDKGVDGKGSPQGYVLPPGSEGKVKVSVGNNAIDFGLNRSVNAGMSSW